MAGNKNQLLKNGAQVKLRAPRDSETIMKEFNDILGKAAQSQYNAYVYKIETDNLNKRLTDLAQEHNERKRLDSDKESSKPSITSVEKEEVRANG